MSTTAQPLLVELFVEELPPKSLKKLGDAFATTLASSLRTQGLLSDDASVTSFATPRRLAVSVSAVLAQAISRAVEHKLMPVAVALDAHGAATPALQKKLASLGAVDVSVAALGRVGEGKAEALVWRTTAQGASLAQGLQAAFDAALAALPIAKVMSYQLGDGWSSVSFVRPAHSIVALHGADVVPIQALGLTSSRNTQGHRFEAKVQTIELKHARDYAQALREQGSVIASFDERRQAIVGQLQAAAQAHGLKPIDDDALLDEVTSLVEKPNVVSCSFDAAFLDVPAECLILTMKANQKYFPLLDTKGALTNEFLVVSNIAPADPCHIVQGNERVVRPRLADAKFFFDKDRKATLASRLPMLDKVVYHAKLGTMAARVERVRAIAKLIGQRLGNTTLAAQVDRAAQLAKCDLVTDMVGEFPELQGVMGGYYALHDGEPEAIAHAVEDHYKPRFAGDTLPRNDVGVVVALADKLETLVGLFGAGEIPSGDKDPFALRRHALGTIRLLESTGMAQVKLPALLTSVLGVFGNLVRDSGVQDAVYDFVIERYRISLSRQGMPGDLLDAHRSQPHRQAIVVRGGTQFDPSHVEAVLSLRPECLGDVRMRLQAVASFARLPEAASLAAANKRVQNILAKSPATAAQAVNPAAFAQNEERALHQHLQDVGAKANAAYQRGDYAASLTQLAALKAPVDAFFDGVMVNAEDATLRNNRLALLAQMHAAMNRVADLSKLAV
jgi:glycyl-tRNA synthetase beta chain